MFMGLYKKKLSMTFLSLAFFFSLIVTGFLFFVMVIVQRDANGEQLRSLLASHSDRLQVSFSLVSDARAKLEADGDLPLFSDACSRLVTNDSGVPAASNARYYYYSARLYAYLRTLNANPASVDYQLALTSIENGTFVITSDGTCDKSLYFSDAESGISADEWKSALSHFSRSLTPYCASSYQKGSLDALYCFFPAFGGCNNLVCILRLPLKTLVGSDSSHPFFIRPDNQAALIPGQFNTLGLSKAGQACLDSLDADFPSQSELLPFHRSMDDLILLRSASLPFTIGYEYRLSRSIKPVTVLYYCVIPLMLFCSVCFSGVWLLAKQLYKPISTVISVLPEASAAPGTPIDEFALIRQNAQTVNSMNEQLRSAIAERAQLVKQSYFRELLFGVPDGDCPLTREEMEDVYCVALIELHATHELSDANDWFLYLQKNLIYSYIQSLHTAEHPLWCFSLEDNLTAVLLNAQNMDFVCDTLNAIFTLEGLEADLTVARSDPQKNVVRLSACYAQARRVMEYRYVLPHNRVLTTEDIEGQTTDSYFYPLVRESQMIQAAASGDPKALTIYDDLLANNHNGEGLAPAVCRNFAFALVGMLMRIFQELKTTPEALLGHPLDTQSILDHWQDATIWSEIRRILSEIIDARRENAVPAADSMFLKMRDYIRVHYCENIMLTDVADHCGIPPAYCSILFKRLSGGETFKAYLNRYRIRRACEFLDKDPRLKIIALSQMVGFNSSNSFIRAFTKEVGITPKAYSERAFTFRAEKQANV